ncbi:MAG TPA: hypothetical protein VJ817_15655, partial [Gemmatimonadales bacterium]|nr:hypothetical protein [Gemmatimonadales bacterium]
MNHIQRLAGSIYLAGLLTATGLVPGGVAAQPSVPQAGTTLFVLDLAGTPVGEIPATIKQLTGILEVVLKNGVPMLKASAASEFRITLPQGLPQDFTLEFELIPKACQGCAPQDLSFEGMREINQGAGSAHVLWEADGHLAVIGGGGGTYSALMPEELWTTLPGVLTRVVVVVEGTTIRLYTNGRRLYTLSNRRFARGDVLRVFLGGQDDGADAVHLAGLRVTAGAFPATVVAATPPALPGQPPSPPRQPGPHSGSASQSQAATGGSVPTVVANVAVTQGTAGPVVSWLPVSMPAVYAVRRWKVDDAACCNAASAPTPALVAPPWQDVPPPVAGTYVYEVTATMAGGVAIGQAQFVSFQRSRQIATV